MSTIDDRLRSGLTADDEAFLKDLEDGRGLFTQMGATFSGPMKFWTVLVFISIFAFLALGIVAVVQLLHTEALNMAVLWSSVLWISFLSIGMLKLWFFMRMNHLATLRELKKIELRLARMEGRQA